MLKRPAAALVLVITLLLAGCGGSTSESLTEGTVTTAAADNADSPEDGPETPSDVRDTTLERRLVLRVEGEHDVVIDEVVPVRFVVREGEGETQQFAVAHVGLPEPRPIDGGGRLNFELGIVGIYEGDGTYELPAGLGPPPTTGPTAQPPSGPVAVSVASVLYLPPSGVETRFGHLLEPCEVVLEQDATVGRGVCPQLVAVDGSTVSLTVSWEAPEG